jgi:cytochrome c-type biogenesis protein CcmE
VKVDTRIIIGSLVAVLILALGYSTVSEYLVEYKTVSEVLKEDTGDFIWVNGTMKEGSLTVAGGSEHFFVLTDGVSVMNVSFRGDLPSSLGTESEILVYGILRGSTFHATRMITKCPTKYEG